MGAPVRDLGGSQRALVECGEDFGVRASCGIRAEGGGVSGESAGEDAFERFFVAGVALPIAIA